MLSYMLIEPHPEQSPCSCTLANPCSRERSCAPVLAHDRSVRDVSEELGPLYSALIAFCSMSFVDTVRVVGINFCWSTFHKNI